MKMGATIRALRTGLAAVLAATGLAALAAPVTASAAILVDSTDAFLPGEFAIGQGYRVRNFTNYLAAQSGGYFAGSLGSASDTASATAILLNLRAQKNAVLSPTEIANLRAAVAAGKRVLLIGDNPSWVTWDRSIAGAFSGASFVTQLTGGAATPVIGNSLTAGVTNVLIVSGGTILGGQQLFSQNVASLFEPSANALLVMDVNLFVNDNRATTNDRFQRNVAAFLGASPSAVPEPATWAMMIVGVGAVGGAMRRRRTVSRRVAFA